MSMMGEERNKGHGNQSVMSSLRRVLSKKVPPSVLEEMRPMMSSSSSSSPPTLPKHSKPPRPSRTLDFSLRDKTDATAKRGFRVQVPKRLLMYTIMVFFVFPLLLGVIVGTRRIYRMHAGYPDEDEGEAAPDLWQQDESQAFDLQTAAKSSSAAVNVTAAEEEEAVVALDNAGDKQLPEVVTEEIAEKDAEAPPKAIETATDEENKPVEEETSNNEENDKEVASDVTPAQAEISSNSTVPNDAEQTAEAEQTPDENDAPPQQDKEAPRIDEQVAPDDAANDAGKQVDAQEGENAPVTNAEERNRLLRGTLQ